MLRHGISHHKSQTSTARSSGSAHTEGVANRQAENVSLCALKQTTRAHSMTLIDALRYVKERRPVVSPNSGFMSQLVELECQLHGNGPTLDLEKYEQHGRCVML